jgi:hypothetical protein
MSSAAAVTSVLALLSLLVVLAQAKSNELVFKITPGAPGKVSVPLDTPPIAGSTCTFGTLLLRDASLNSFVHALLVALQMLTSLPGREAAYPRSDMNSRISHRFISTRT